MEAQRQKSEQIRGMFNDISHRYDLLNYLLSFGQDRGWRKKALKMLSPEPGSDLLDIACGTGDVALTAARLYPRTGSITGIDFSEKMIELAGKKFDGKKVSVPYEFKVGDATDLPLPGSCADCVTIAFGIRNVVDVPRALLEMKRVLRPGGKLMILEFAPPRGRVFGPLFHFYFNKVLPKVGGWISGKPEAYSYLPKSVGEFYSPEKLQQLMENAGFSMERVKKLTFGVTMAYLAIRK